jgi:hypothetical protein
MFGMTIVGGRIILSWTRTKKQSTAMRIVSGDWSSGLNKGYCLPKELTFESTERTFDADALSGLALVATAAEHRRWQRIAGMVIDVVGGEYNALVNEGALGEQATELLSVNI